MSKHLISVPYCLIIILNNAGIFVDMLDNTISPFCDNYVSYMQVGLWKLSYNIQCHLKATEQVRGCIVHNWSHRRTIFKKAPKPMHRFKSYRTKNDMKMFLTGKINIK